MNRPKVICHILSSLDGRIDGDFFMLPETMALGRKYGQIRKEGVPQLRTHCRWHPGTGSMPRM